jgi:hypothetical protein
MPQNARSSQPAITPAGVTTPLHENTAGSLIEAQQGATPYNDATGSAGHQIVSGAGVFTSFNVNTAGTSSHATLYDGTSTSGVKLATIDTSAVFSHTYNLKFAVGLFIVSSTVTPADITVGYTQ